VSSDDEHIAGCLVSIQQVNKYVPLTVQSPAQLTVTKLFSNHNRPDRKGDPSSYREIDLGHLKKEVRSRFSWKEVSHPEDQPHLTQMLVRLGYPRLVIAIYMSNLTISYIRAREVIMCRPIFKLKRRAN
jgi:hypothetical protein